MVARVGRRAAATVLRSFRCRRRSELSEPPADDGLQRRPLGLNVVSVAERHETAVLGEPLPQAFLRGRSMSTTRLIQRALWVVRRMGREP